MLTKILNNLRNYPSDECYQIKDRVYTNKELYKYVCNIYEYLIQNNSDRKNVVVYGHKDIYMLASFLACSFAGMTYIPIDTSIPEKRKQSIIEQVKPKIIIDEKINNIIQIANYKDISKIYLQDNDIYYIIFTSGSTGEPKGVKILYKNLKSLMNWLIKICNTNNQTILNQANFSFDLSVADIYLPLLTRGKHYILERETQKDFISLFKELKKSNSEMGVFTPSFADLLLLDKSFNKNMLPNFKKILFCGERLTEKTVSKLYERFNDIEIINSYGPTECTFAVTSTIIKKDEDVSIGVPKDDVNIYIVNENLEELQENEVGEILISGESVGDGYLNKNLNKDVFITYKNQKSYLTGDLGYKKNNKLYCIGRKDKQIKYKGYRIELLEIENVINKFDFVEKAVITTIQNKEGKVNKIIAFIKEKEENIINMSEIKQIIKNNLPDYMIPVIKIVKEIPLNENGKVNEKMLLEGFAK